MTPEECLNKYIKLVYHFSNKLPFDRQSDAIQEGIVALLKCNEEFKPEMGTQFITIALPNVKRAVLYDRREYKWRKNSTTEFDEILHMQNEVKDDCFAIALQQAIGLLDDKEKQVIKLKYFDSERVEFIAKKLGVSRQSIHAWERTAISKLRLLLFKED